MNNIINNDNNSFSNHPVNNSKNKSKIKYDNIQKKLYSKASFNSEYFFFIIITKKQIFNSKIKKSQLNSELDKISIDEDKLENSSLNISIDKLNYVAF
jgi:hypothetical protein